MPAPANDRTAPSSTPSTAGSRDGGQGQFDHGRRLRSGTTPHGRPDAAALAREAVIRFLNDASKATADRAAGIPASATGTRTETGMRTLTGTRTEIEMGTPMGTGGGVSVAGRGTAPRATASGWVAAAISVATLDRIEAAAAKVEADIAVALRAYADLQAGAGAAAEAAVHAAQSAMASAGVATEAERQVRISLRQVRQYVVVTVVLLVVVIIILAEVTSPVK